MAISLPVLFCIDFVVWRWKIIWTSGQDAAIFAVWRAAMDLHGPEASRKYCRSCAVSGWRTSSHRADTPPLRRLAVPDAADLGRVARRCPALRRAGGMATPAPPEARCRGGHGFLVVSSSGVRPSGLTPEDPKLHGRRVMVSADHRLRRPSMTKRSVPQRPLPPCGGGTGWGGLQNI